TAQPSITVRSRSVSVSYKLPPSAKHHRQREDHEQRHDGPHQLRFAAGFTAATNREVAYPERQRRGLLHILRGACRVRHHFTHRDERRVASQQVVLQTKRGYLFRVFIFNLVTAVVRQLGNSRARPQVTQRTVCFVGLRRGNVELRRVKPLARLAGQFKL